MAKDSIQIVFSCLWSATKMDYSEKLINLVFERKYLRELKEPLNYIKLFCLLFYHFYWLILISAFGRGRGLIALLQATTRSSLSRCIYVARCRFQWTTGVKKQKSNQFSAIEIQTLWHFFRTFQFRVILGIRQNTDRKKRGRTFWHEIKHINQLPWYIKVFKLIFL